MSIQRIASLTRARLLSFGNLDVSMVLIKLYNSLDSNQACRVRNLH